MMNYNNLLLWEKALEKVTGIPGDIVERGNERASFYANLAARSQIITSITWFIFASALCFTVGRSDFNSMMGMDYPCIMLGISITMAFVYIHSFHRVDNIGLPLFILFLQLLTIWWSFMKLLEFYRIGTYPQGDPETPRWKLDAVQLLWVFCIMSKFHYIITGTLVTLFMLYDWLYIPTTSGVWTWTGRSIRVRDMNRV